jgi:TRAP-type C4-dicarboxylate transport system substrate-binding protein
VIGGQQKISVMLAHLFPMANPLHATSVTLAELAAQKSGGIFDVQVFPAGRLGDDKAQFAQVRQGGVQMALGSSGILAETVAAYDTFEAPYLFDDKKHFSKVIRAPIRVDLSERLIKAAGVRTPEIPVYVETFRALGGSPTPLPYLEAYLALQQGTIDGAENPLSSGTDRKWPEVAKFVALTHHQATGQSFQVNERWYQGLSPDLRKLVDESCLEASEFLAGLMVERGAREDPGCPRRRCRPCGSA